ncbi:hypothetical protein P4O66_005353, partial [Electrophorus voltai]
EVLKEDESGSLRATVEDILFQAKRKRVFESHGQVRLGMMRHLYVVIDLSRSMEDQDLKPNRLTSTLKLMEYFVDEYFDQNPISQIGIITTKNKRAERLTDLAGNPKKHTAALKKTVDSACMGEPSLYNALSIAMQTLKHMPGHTSREILVIFSSLTTCDPANIYDLIKTLKALKIRVSVIGLSAEVRVCTVLTRETGGSVQKEADGIMQMSCRLTYCDLLCSLAGSYSVILDESHYKELLMLHVRPPPASSSSECSLIRMGMSSFLGFPQHVITSVTDRDAKPSFSMSHLDSSSEDAGLTLGGYYCPSAGPSTRSCLSNVKSAGCVYYMGVCIIWVCVLYVRGGVCIIWVCVLYVRGGCVYYMYVGVCVLYVRGGVCIICTWGCVYYMYVGLTLVSAPHLARSFHHLFPLSAFEERPLEEHTGDRHVPKIHLTLKLLKGKERMG